jgi:hypothetical protein
MTNVEVQWEVNGRPVWWAARMRTQPDGAAELDYVRRGNTPAHRAFGHVMNSRELVDAETESVLRWRRARHAPTFTAADLQELQESAPEDPHALADAEHQLRHLAPADQRRLHAGMTRLREAVAAHLADLPPGHVVTPADIAAATAGLHEPEASIAASGQ